jgi:hypothetical protein
MLERVTKQVGVCLPNLANSQASYFAINEANMLCNSTANDVILFYEDLIRPLLKPLCATMNLSEITSFSGLLIGTTFNIAERMIKTVSPAVNIFYVWDLTWLRNERDFLRNAGILSHPGLEIVARSMDHAEMIRKYCNREVSAVIDDFDLMKFLEIFGERIRVPRDQIFN